MSTRGTRMARGLVAAVATVMALVVWGLLAPVPGRGAHRPTPAAKRASPLVSPAGTGQDVQEALGRRMRALITPDVYPDIAWHMLRDDEVYLGWRRWPPDGPSVVLAIAREADKVVRQVEGHIAGNATVWAIRADADRDHLPGHHCYYWATTDEGWIDTSDGRRHPPLD